MEERYEPLKSSGLEILLQSNTWEGEEDFRCLVLWCDALCDVGGAYPFEDPEDPRIFVCVNMGAWSELNEDLLIEIIKRLTLYEDLVTFSLVCTSWLSVAVKEKPRFLSKPPWLMLPPEKPNTCRRGFYSFSDNMTRQVMIPEAEGSNKRAKRCLSSGGWILTISKRWSMALLHPFSRRQIELPHMTTFKNWDYLSSVLYRPHISFITKFVLSSNPFSTSDYIVMVLHGSKRELAYCKPGEGDKSWTTIETSASYNHDVTYYNGLFYVIKDTGQMTACDIRSDMAEQVAEMPSDYLKYPLCLYLVESGGELLVVSRVVEREDISKRRSTYRTSEFLVFKVDLRSNTWTEMKNLGNRAVFVGYNSSFSIEAMLCKSNCIYFTDDSWEIYTDLTSHGGGKDMGIYNLQDGSIEPHFRGNSYSFMNPPMWVQPSFFRKK
ncbi:putative F-box protein At5g55150 [Pistacia vera]|uniref:putative F-box protein At5g55150 n=1 Tax=Pistacia vera TaxID=55513 RepID=UPI00126303AC|nr:putative F-box protein At5g55150 [Pistacia vera]